MDETPEPTDAPEPSFEEAVEQLEAIIERIESGEVGLEQAIHQYEEGCALVNRCRLILDRAERRIAELTEDSEGRPVLTPMPGESGPGGGSVGGVGGGGDADH